MVRTIKEYWLRLEWEKGNKNITEDVFLGKATMWRTPDYLDEQIGKKIKERALEINCDVEGVLITKYYTNSYTK